VRFSWVAEKYADSVAAKERSDERDRANSSLGATSTAVRFWDFPSRSGVCSLRYSSTAWRHSPLLDLQSY